MKLAALAVLCATVLVSGCAPYPIYKNLQPAARVMVRDQANQPVAKAEVTLITQAHARIGETLRTTKETLPDGTAAFESVSEWRIEVMALHGWEQFYWRWCVRKDGYITQPSLDFNANLTVKLEPGPSTPCPTWPPLKPASK